MLYIGLWIFAMSMAGLASEAYPTFCKWRRRKRWKPKKEARVKTTIILGEKNEQH